MLKVTVQLFVDFKQLLKVLNP